MSPFSDQLIKAQIQKNFYTQAAKKLGVNKTQSAALTQKALPILIKGLAENTQTEKGTTALWTALSEKKHRGQILDVNEDFFAKSKIDDGSKILRHILGDTRDDITAALAAETKTDVSAAKKIMAALSPLIMGALGKAVQSKKLNADQVGSILKLTLKEKNFAKAGHKIAIMLFDKNNNGQYKDDLFEMGKKLFLKMLNQKKK